MRIWESFVFTSAQLEWQQARGCVLCTCSLSLTEWYVVYYENVWNASPWIDATGKHLSPHSFIYLRIFSLVYCRNRQELAVTKRQL